MTETNRLREHIDKLFADAPPTRRAAELKEELLQNLTEKYDDLVSQGKTPDAAYNVAVASIGDVSALIGELRGAPSYTPEQEQELRAYQQRKALLTAIAVMLYILSPVPVIVIAGLPGLLLLFVFVATATGLLIYQSMNKPLFLAKDDTVTEEFKQWRENTSKGRQLFKALSSALWAVAVVIYFLLSFYTGQWHITWVVFPIAGALSAILKAVIDLKQ